MSSLSSDLLINPQDLFDITVNSATSGVGNDVTQLGALATTGDGRYYRFCLAGGTALVPGKLQQSIAEDTSNWENLSIAAAAVGATSITTTSTVTLAVNLLANGYVMVTTSNGAGYQYQIGSHAVAAGAVVTFNIVDPIVVALTTSSKIDAIPSPYMNLVVNPTAASGLPVGVAVAATPASYYGWVQTRGPAVVLADGTVTVGTSVCASNGTAGAVEATAGVQALVGTAITGIATTEYGAINLNIS